MKSTHRQSTLDSFRNYIGIPYEEQDCYEIIQTYYREVLNLELDDLYSSRPSTEKTEQFYLEQRTRFKEIDTPEFGDIIVFKVFGLACHIGMYVDKVHFFHSRKTTNSCLEKLSIWKNRVVGYYRWPQLKSE